MPHGAACSCYPLEQSLSFIRETPTIIYIIKRHFLELVMAREGRKVKGRNDQRERFCMWKTIVQFVIVYTRVPDMFVEIFAGTVILKILVS